MQIFDIQQTFSYLYPRQKRFKRLKRMQMEDSDAEEEEDGGMDREKIANQLFDGDDVSLKNYNV